MNGDSGDGMEELEKRMSLIEQKFIELSDDFTNLRHEVNELERKIERRT